VKLEDSLESLVNSNLRVPLNLYPSSARNYRGTRAKCVVFYAELTKKIHGSIPLFDQLVPTFCLFLSSQDPKIERLLP
jgi:hypothetical protein